MLGQGLFDRIAAALYRRGQSIVDAKDRAAEERRATVRSVRDSVSNAMVSAETDREHGIDEAGMAAVASANRASSVVHEIADEEARHLVADWKSRFDAIPKGWKKRASVDSRPELGYPEPAWTELKQAADAALDRLGSVLRKLLAKA